MTTENVASNLQLLPEHLKEDAKEKFHKLTAATKNSGEKLERISSSLATKVRSLKDDLIINGSNDLSSSKKLESITKRNEIQDESNVELALTKSQSNLRWLKENGSTMSKIMIGCWLIYMAGYYEIGLLYITFPLLLYYIHLNSKEEKKAKLQYARDVSKFGEEFAITKRIDEHLLPSWFQFPDTERVDWINRMVFIIWPYLTNYISRTLRLQAEPVVRDILESYRLWGFKFNEINFGNSPPRVEGLKVYSDTGAPNEIVMDAEISFGSSEDSHISISILKFGASISEFSFSGHLRLIFKPLIDEPPIVGGLQVFFLKPPKIDFDLGGAAQVLDFPGLNSLLKSAINDAISEKMVNPNRLTLSLSDKISPVDLKMPKPIGVITIQVIEAKDLPKMDVGLSKCDPYIIISHGHIERKTAVKSGTDPVWNETIAFAIEIPETELLIAVFDQDSLSGDDFIGQTKFDISTLIEIGGFVDVWMHLDGSDGTANGKLHLKITWQQVSTIRDPASGSHGGVLSIFLDSVQTRPVFSDVPQVMVRMSGGSGEKTDSAIVLGRDPAFEEGHVILLKEIEQEYLHFKILDMAEDFDQGDELAFFKFPIQTLLNEKDLYIGLKSYELPEWKGRIKFAVQLQYLSSPHLTDEPSTMARKAAEFSDSSKRVARRAAINVSKTLGSVAKSIRTKGVNTVYQGIDDVTVGSITSTALKTIGSAASGTFQKMSTPLEKFEDETLESQDVKETHFDESFKISEIKGLKKIQKHHESSSSDENGHSFQHQSSVRRRLSESLKSFSFRK